uniref:Uncharacterized protein n=1 Tax=viral metagenome TaxID=1070528 RepID=A0A6C0JNG2_9ZZZZ
MGFTVTMGCASSLPVVTSGAPTPAPSPKPIRRWPGLCPAEEPHPVPPFINFGGHLGGP